VLPWLAGRLAAGALTLAVVGTTVFFLIRLAPGDPFSASLESPRFTAAQRHEYMARFGLDRPLPTQYVKWVQRVARGDLGHSIGRGRSVRAVLADALPHTLLLGATALAIDFALGIALGTIQAALRGRRTDRALSTITLLLYATPVFWFGLLLLLVFTEWFGWFPPGGAYDAALYDTLGLWGRLADRVHHLVLPACTLGLIGAAGTARFHRSALLGALDEAYVRTARAKGLSERRVVLRHGMRTALLPVLTLFGLALPFVVGGSVLVESVFAWPGLGRVTVDAVGARDYDLVAAATLLAATMVVVGSLAADVMYRLLDPRTREAAP
jgi:peptide/nickel transport system permease protein